MLPQVTLQSTVKPSVAPKHSRMDYQTFRPMTKPPQKQRIFTRSNFAEHNYNYVIDRKHLNLLVQISISFHFHNDKIPDNTH